MQRVLLDTSIILDDIQNLIHLHQQNKQLYITDVVLEELDKKKIQQNESGYFAREFFRCVTNIIDNSCDQFPTLHNLQEHQQNFQTDFKDCIDLYTSQEKAKSDILIESPFFEDSPPCKATKYGTYLSTLSAFEQKSTRTQNIQNDLKFLPRESSKPKQENFFAEFPLQALQTDSIMQILFQSQNEKLPIWIILRPKYKTAFMEYGWNDARIREIAKDYGLLLLTNDVALRVRAITEKIQSDSLQHTQIRSPKEIQFIHNASLLRDLSDKEALQENPQFQQLSDWNLFEIDEYDYTGNSKYHTGRKHFGFKLHGKLEILDIDKIIKETKPYILPINKEQKLAFSLLTHHENKISIITGSTGSGKTLMALQAGLCLQKQGVVDGIVYLRNTITANDKEAELGFRKGDEEQKLHYFMYPLFSSINFIIENLKEHSLPKQIEYNGDSKGFEKKEITQYFLEKHRIEILDIAHARGISLHHKFIIFDEVQNATDATIKLIGTRVGEKSRIVFLGDYNQVDHPYLSKMHNGALTLLAKAQMHDFIFGLQFKQTIRSEVAHYFDEYF